MSVEELIKNLRCFDPEHEVNLEIVCDNCGYRSSDIRIEDIQYKFGNVKLIGYIE